MLKIWELTQKNNMEVPKYEMIKVERIFRENVKIHEEQAEAEVVPSSGSVQFKLESNLACIIFIKFILVYFS